MKKIVYAFLLLMLTFWVTFQPVSAKESQKRLLDEADLLTPQQEETIEFELGEISEEYNANIVIATVNSLEGNEPKKHASVMYKRMGYKGSGMILLISMEDRDVCVRPKGDYDGYELPVFETDYILEEITSYLSDGNYATAFSTYIDLTRECIDRDLESEYYEEVEYEYTDTIMEFDDFVDVIKNGSPSEIFQMFLPWLEGLVICLVFAFVISFVIMCIFQQQLKSVRANNYAAGYIKPGSMKVEHSDETFLYKNVTKSRRQKETSSHSSSSRSSSRSSSSSGSRSGGSSGKF